MMPQRKRDHEPDLSEYEALLAQAKDKAMHRKKAPTSSPKKPTAKKPTAKKPAAKKGGRAKGIRQYVERVQQWGKEKIAEIEKPAHHKGNRKGHK